MYSIILCAVLAIVIALVSVFAFKLVWWWAILLSVIVATLTFVVLSRIIMKKVMAGLDLAMRDLQGQRFEKAIRGMKDMLKLAPWQVYLEGQVNSQIGMAYYVKRDFSAAFPYLEKAFFKNWASMGMLAICYMKRQKRDKMEKTFEKAVQWSSKESLLWNLYAYCLAEECNDRGKAKEVLERGLKKMPGDPDITANLENLAAGNRMKMRSFGDPWYQFHLESMGQLQKHQMAAMGGKMKRRTVVRK
ncbi:MAG: hypothetical protein RBQ99_04235 [Trichlorobacter sp.]|nr:hypothetical protein [Trichlorobacter sp.]